MQEEQVLLCIILFQMIFLYNFMYLEIHTEYDNKNEQP